MFQEGQREKEEKEEKEENDTEAEFQTGAVG